jgi:hypothetical protein
VGKLLEMIKGIQILGMLVGFYLAAQSILNYRLGNYGSKRTLFLVGVWSVMIVLFFNPSLSLMILPILTTKDMIMTVLVLGILFSFILITQLYQQISIINKKLTQLAQSYAINEYIENDGTSS